MERENPETECNEFQSNLPDLMLKEASLFNHPHVCRCERCRALLEDLETIAREAGRGGERGEI